MTDPAKPTHEPVQPLSRADNNCFICGPDNPMSLGVVFHLQGERAVAQYRPPAQYCGWDGVTHGGIVYSLLDDAMANWLALTGDRGFTARCDVRYRQQTPVETDLVIEGWQESRKGRLAMMGARILDQASGKVLAEAQGRFMLEPRESASA